MAKFGANIGAPYVSKPKAQEVLTATSYPETQIEDFSTKNQGTSGSLIETLPVEETLVVESKETLEFAIDTVTEQPKSETWKSRRDKKKHVETETPTE